MPKVAIYNVKGAQVGEKQLSDAVFGVEMNEPAVHQVIVAMLANRRQGTKSALTRAEVRGGGIKPYRQKGTGRARQGSIRNPHYRHGGVAFAPKPRDFRQSINKKMRRLAVCCSLSSKVAEGSLVVLDEMTLEAPKTRLMSAVLKTFDAQKKTVLVTATNDETVRRAAQNIAELRMVPVDSLNVMDILDCDKFIITDDAVAHLEEVYA